MEQNKKPAGQHYAQKSPSRGGARTGAGRPKGSTNKITMEDLLASLDTSLGRPYHEQLADNYVSAISRSDWGNVRDYDKVFLGKLVADKQEVEIKESEDTVAAKQEAFAQALADLVTVTLPKDKK